MKLTPEEQAMAQGQQGPAVARAMDLLIRYGQALGAERLVPTRNVVASVNATTPFMRDFAQQRGGMDAVFSEFSLDSDETVKIPPFKTFTTHTQLGFSPDDPQRMGVDESTVHFYRQGEVFLTGLGLQATNTCTPYQVGNLPSRGEHCAWMESSAVVYCNSVLGARTNTEGRESVGAAMVTGRIPYWGYHLSENRWATHAIEVQVSLHSTSDWGLLGYWVGDQVQEKVPVLTGVQSTPTLAALKHFGASASSSGGVEMYHIVGLTPEAPSLQEALGHRQATEYLTFGLHEMRHTWEKINATGLDDKVDYVMLGCPHYSLEQLWEVGRMMQGRKVHPDCEMWIFTARAIKSIADQNGTTRLLEEAGVRVLTDSCSAMSRAVPRGARVAAFDSAKQAHYLPAIAGVQAWFGTTAECVEAACTGRWQGRFQAGAA